MIVDENDIELIMAIHKQFYLTKDERVRHGLYYVLKDILGRYLIQIKHYEPYVSEEAEKRIKEVLKNDFPNIKISQIKLHDCNVKNPVSLSKEQKKYFVKGNSYKKLFHLEHDPPTLKVVHSILDMESITYKEIEDKLEPYRLCFITVEENFDLNKKGWKSEKRPANAYDECGINVKKVNND